MEEGGNCIMRPSGVEVMVVVVRRVERRDWAPSRAMVWRWASRSGLGSDVRVLEGGRGLGSVAVR